MLKKQGRHYWLDIRVQGHRIRRSLKTGEYRLALARAQEKTRELEERNPRKDISLQEFSRRYLEWAWSTKPASTLAEEYRLKIILAFFKTLGIEYLIEIKPYHIEQLRIRLQADGRSRSTINRYAQLIRGMIYRAIDWGQYEGPNPAKKIKFYREQPKITPLSETDAKKVLAAAKKISTHPGSPLQRAFYNILVFAFNTGMRKSEILNMRWSDLRGDEIEVRGKGEKTRMIPLNEKALAIIIRQPKRGEFIWNIQNRHQDTLTKRTFKQIRKLSGVPHFHLHLCRHYFTTQLLRAGVDIQTASELLGHSRGYISLIYSHVSPERKRQAVQMLDIKDGQRPVDVLVARNSHPQETQ